MKYDSENTDDIQSEKYIVINALNTLITYQHPSKGTVVSILFRNSIVVDGRSEVKEKVLELSKKECSGLLWHKLLVRANFTREYIPLVGFYRTDIITATNMQGGRLTRSDSKENAILLKKTKYSISGHKGNYDKKGDKPDEQLA